MYPQHKANPAPCTHASLCHTQQHSTPQLFADGCEHGHTSVLDLCLPAPASKMSEHLEPGNQLLSGVAQPPSAPLEHLDVQVLRKSEGVPEAQRCLVAGEAFEAWQASISSRSTNHGEVVYLRFSISFT